MLPAASFSPLTSDLYEIPYGHVLGRPVGDPGGFQDFGDVDGFSLNLNPTRKQRYGKNGRTSYLALESTVRIDSAITVKAMQKTDLIRGASLLGVAYKVSQAAGPVAASPIVSLVPGQIYPVGAYCISSPVMEYDNGSGALIALPSTYFTLVDPAMGLVQLTGLPQDAKVGANGFIAGSISATVAALDSSAPMTRVDIGTVPQLAMELIVRNIGDVGPKGFLHIYQANLAPDGELGFITGNDDFESVTVKGRALITSLGIGQWGSLPA